MDVAETVNFEGHIPRECGEHRTVGPHRAWCYDCQEWCYPRPDMACARCELPMLRGQIERVQVMLAALDDGEEATKGRDFGRGVAHATKLIGEALQRPADPSPDPQETPA